MDDWMHMLADDDGKLSTMITIQILESPAKNRLLVSWRESGICNYTEQLWALRKAKRTTLCAISGQPVRLGDEIYRPVGKPLNSATCILAGAVKLPPKAN
jgi:hypothetical protein